MDALSTMRSKVNRMVHKEGEVQNDEFVFAAARMMIGVLAEGSTKV